ncbi:MAG: cobalt ECF transporter T component CbiQ [Syntrophomonadaceae bacterium]|jgi:cobalt/nickel transport system permease protein
MNRIDQTAYCSPWCPLHPLVKVSLAMATLLVVLVLDSRMVSLFALFAISALVVFAARVSRRLYLGLMSIPLFFLLMGCATVAVNSSIQPDGIWPGLYIGGMWWGVSEASLQQAVNLLLRCLASVSAMYLLALTTPVVQLVYVMRLLKFPSVAADLTGLIYINIFTFLQTAQDIYIAQQSRCGYQSFRGYLNSLSALLSSLFIKNLQRNNSCCDALLARGFDGSLQVLEEEYIVKPLHFAAGAAFIASLFLIYCWGGWLCTLT